MYAAAMQHVTQDTLYLMLAGQHWTADVVLEWRF